MKKFKRFVGVEEEEEPTLAEQLDECFSLSLKNRLIGFGVCAAIGLLLSFLGFILLIFLIALTAFAILYTFGNIFMLISTGFLVGPVKQLKNMCAPTRIIATLVYILAIILTLLSALMLKSMPLAVICLIIQVLALTWYTLSYVPGARFIAKKCFGSLMG